VGTLPAVEVDALEPLVPPVPGLLAPAEPPPPAPEPVLDADGAGVLDVPEAPVEVVLDGALPVVVVLDGALPVVVVVGAVVVLVVVVGAAALVVVLVDACWSVVADTNSVVAAFAELRLAVVELELLSAVVSWSSAAVRLCSA
jgi:hypothetical protein